MLSEARPAVAAGDQNALFVRGRLVAGARLNVMGPVQQTRVDRAAQEDSLRFTFAGTAPADAAIEEAKPIDITRESNGQLSLLLDYRVTGAPSGEVTLGMEGGKTASVPITGALKGELGQWRQLAVPLRCFADGGVAMGAVSKPWIIATSGTLNLDISSIRIASAPPGPVSCGVR